MKKISLLVLSLSSFSLAAQEVLLEGFFVQEVKFLSKEEYLPEGNQDYYLIPQFGLRFTNSVDQLDSLTELFQRNDSILYLYRAGFTPLCFDLNDSVNLSMNYGLKDFLENYAPFEELVEHNTMVMDHKTYDYLKDKKSYFIFYGSLMAVRLANKDCKGVSSWDKFFYGRANFFVLDSSLNRINVLFWSFL